MTFPNQLTVLRMILAPVGVLLLLSADLVTTRIGTAVFIFASFTDWYDGHFARKYGYVTDTGKFLDPLADKILITSMLLCFILLGHIEGKWVIIIVTRDIIITALRGYMMMYNNNPMPANILAKWKTVAQVTLVYAILLYINIEQTVLAVNPGYSGNALAQVSSFIVYFTQFVAYYTVLTGLLYLYDNRKPLKALFIKFHSKIFPLIPASEKEDLKHSAPIGSSDNENKE